MPRVSDFITIIGHVEIHITATRSDFAFGTGGRESGGQAFIIFNIRNLRETLPVKVNDHRIGFLAAYPNTADFQGTAWFTNY